MYFFKCIQPILFFIYLIKLVCLNQIVCEIINTLLNLFHTPNCEAVYVYIILFGRTKLRFSLLG